MRYLNKILTTFYDIKFSCPVRLSRAAHRKYFLKCMLGNGSVRFSYALKRNLYGYSLLVEFKSLKMYNKMNGYNSFRNSR